jgi:hypothetical protein
MWWKWRVLPPGVKARVYSRFLLLYRRVTGGHLYSLLTRPLGFLIEINVSFPSVLVSAPRFSSRLVLSCLVLSCLVSSCPCPAPIGERSAVSPAFVRTTPCPGLRLRFSSLVFRSRTLTRLHGMSHRDTRSRRPFHQFTMSASSTSLSHARVRVRAQASYCSTFRGSDRYGLLSHPYLQELSKIEVDTSDPRKVEEVMQQIRSLAVQILESHPYIMA